VIDSAVAAIRAGRPVVLPTDTVYGLCSSPYTEDAVRRLSKLKGRDEQQPIAIVASDVDMLFELVPELRGRWGVLARELLPGAYTLVLPNPARRFRWLSGTRPETIGVRVPTLTGYAQQVLERVGAVAATSANLTGTPDPRRISDIPQSILDGVAEVVDDGELPGTPSTVIDFTTPEPTVIRRGAGDVNRALALATVG
jgi:L-threonylcarbamoyladenylate synthase